jgi:hypothetical protein
MRRGCGGIHEGGNLRSALQPESTCWLPCRSSRWVVYPPGDSDTLERERASLDIFYDTGLSHSA